MDDETISVHDNNVYGYVVDCENERITLHTEFDQHSVRELTDVVFEGVAAHLFNYVLEGNILFEIYEVPTDEIVDQTAPMFQESWRWGWPVRIEYAGDLDVLKSELRQRSLKGFRIDSSYGLQGWVLAMDCKRMQRETQASLSWKY